VAGAIFLALRLFEGIGVELDAPALVEYLVDLACASGLLEVMDNAVVVVSKESLLATGVRRT
jgi:hypothetical protein